MRFGRGDTILAARYLIGARVVDHTGTMMGRVIDIEVDPAADFKVLAVELGRHGWIDRVRALRPIAHDRLGAPPRMIAWSDIDRFENGRLHCKPGAQVIEFKTNDEEEQPAPDRTAAGG